VPPSSTIVTAEAPPGRESGPPGQLDIICFSHLRWNFVFQRPQHLLTRFATDRRVFFLEEPIFLEETADREQGPRLDLSEDPSGVVVAVPRLSASLTPDQIQSETRALLDSLIEAERILQYVSWYYTPMARSFSGHLRPRAIVYDCMDELSGFAGAPSGLREAEAELLKAADIVFTGGQSLFAAKRALHHNVHACPSSVDAEHFGRARLGGPEPDDQKWIPQPRLGYFGVIDERLDIALLDAVAAQRPDWQIVMVGPVVKVDPATLPRRRNIHYLGPKAYADLPTYIAGWSVALLPFARNEATRFISPTKTPEYLAAGRPVVSTSIHDVVRPYGEMGLARIADTPEEFVAAIEGALADRGGSLQAADAFLARTSWQATFTKMAALMDSAVLARSKSFPQDPPSHSSAAASVPVTGAAAAIRIP
jgi:UDP-galactopyranose mutase